MKVLNVSQIRELDDYTIQHEPVKSIDLMERAGTSCVDWILEHFNTYQEAVVFCGTGNNGGDGVVIARQLSLRGWKVDVVYPDFGKSTEDFRTNLDRLNGIPGISYLKLGENDPLPNVSAQALVIDALVGSGLSRPLTGVFEKWTGVINTLPNIVISIDIPSGLLADATTTGLAMAADFTLSFELPKRAFLIPENQKYLGEWIVLPIGLAKERLDQLETNWVISTEDEVASMLLLRQKFDHKGTFGHALIIAGSYGKAGAAILASQAALRSGAGLVSSHVPGFLNSIIQTAIPEVMIETDNNQFHFTHLNAPGKYSATGIGCGLGTDEETVSGLRNVFTDLKTPVVIDADAINIIASHSDMLALIPANAILTPHLKEFERLFGASDDHFDRLEKLRSAAIKHQIIIVLKGAHTAIASPEGYLYFNTTGNPGMATAGSGDVLTGIITGLLAQRYPPLIAAKLGVWLHGLAGDFAAEETGYEALIASDIINHLGAAFGHLHAIRLISEG